LTLQDAETGWAAVEVHGGHLSTSVSLGHSAANHFLGSSLVNLNELYGSFFTSPATWHLRTAKINLSLSVLDRPSSGFRLRQSLGGYPRPLSYLSANEVLWRKIWVSIHSKRKVSHWRSIIAEQSDLTGDGTDYVEMDKLPKDHRFWKHQDIVNEGDTPSETVIQEHIKQKGGEYRQVVEGAHPLGKYRA